MTVCNIKQEIVPTSQPNPATIQDNRLTAPSVPYAQQLFHIEPPQQRSQCSVYQKEQQNYQMYNAQATNVYPHSQVNQNFMPLQHHNQIQNHNMNYNPPTYDDNSYQANENYYTPVNYPQSAVSMSTMQPQPTTSNWPMQNNVTSTNNWYPNGNNGDLMHHGTTMNFQNYFTEVPRHNEKTTMPISTSAVLNNANIFDTNLIDFDANLSNLRISIDENTPTR